MLVRVVCESWQNKEQSHGNCVSKDYRFSMQTETVKIAFGARVQKQDSVLLLSAVYVDLIEVPSV